MKLSTILEQNAQFVSKSNVSVERSVFYSQVLMWHNDAEGNTEVFCDLHGDEADQFNDLCNDTYNKVQTLGMDVVELAMCYEYLTLLEGFSMKHIFTMKPEHAFTLAFFGIVGSAEWLVETLVLVVERLY